MVRESSFSKNSNSTCVIRETLRLFGSGILDTISGGVLSTGPPGGKPFPECAAEVCSCCALPVSLHDSQRATTDRELVAPRPGGDGADVVGEALTILHGAGVNHAQGQRASSADWPPCDRESRQAVSSNQLPDRSIRFGVHADLC